MDYSSTPTVDSSYASASPMTVVIQLVLVVFYVWVFWKLFVKAGKPGWAAIIPFYNAYVQLKIIGRPGWWLLLFLIPIVNIVIAVIVAIDTAKSFGKSAAYGVVGLFLFGFIGYPVLALSKSTTYVGPAAGGGAGAAPAAPAAPTTPAAPAA